MKQRNVKSNISSIFVILVVIFVCAAVSFAVLFSRITTYTQAKFVNVMPLTETNDTYTNTVSVTTYSDGKNNNKNPQFVMEATADIFKFSYDNESGKITVIGDENNTDKLIAPGTTNLYQFTLKNPGDVALDYSMTMEAYITGTEEYLPVNARVFDYKNNYLLGSADNMEDVLELNNVSDSGELGAGRYAIYNLEWEWPFEWDDDEHDTMLGNLAAEDDLVLHIKIRTIAQYDDYPENPNEGLINPPKTGDDSQLVLLSLLCAGSLAGLCAMIFAFLKSGRKEKQAK